MRTHTSGYKNALMGVREIDHILTNVSNNQIIDNADLKSIRPLINGDLLKSNMKELDLESKINIPLDTELNLQFGVKVGNDYEYLNFGNYIVYESNYEADTKLYRITCYDKILYSMVDYEKIMEYVLTEDEEFIEDKTYYTNEYVEYTGDRTGNPSQLGLYEYAPITYPITIRDYITKLCNFLGYEFANKNDVFPNYDKIIQNELYLDERGQKIGYTFRDTLDQLAQATASTICINENDELELKYINDTQDTINENYFKSINVEFGEKYGPVNSIVLSRSGESDNVFLQDETSVETNGLCEIKIIDNQIMNFNDRDTYLPDILDELDGLEYYLNDFVSPGITYYELCDMYSVQIGEDTYNCLLINDDITITKGLSESIHTDLPEESVTDYKTADTTDRKINQAYIIVNKQNQTIEALTSRTSAIENTQSIQYQDLMNKFNDYATLDSIDTITTQVTQLQTDTYTKTQIQEIANGTGVDGVTVTAVISTEAQFDSDGMHYSKTDAPTSSTINYKGLEVDDTHGQEIMFAGYDEDPNSLTYGTSIVRTDNLNVTTYLQCANNKGRFEEYTDSNNHTGVGFFLT